MGAVHAGTQVVMIDSSVIDRCAGEITRDIINGRYKPGDELPAVGRLVQVYGSRRLVIEAALRVLLQKETVVVTGDPSGGRQIYRVPEAPLIVGTGSEPDALDEEYITVGELATAIRVSKMTAYRLINDGQIEAVRVGRLLRIPRRAASEYLDGQRT